MSIYDGFIARMKISGVSPKEASENVTKRNQKSLIMNSPSRSDVGLDSKDNLQPCIVSDVDTFHKRRFLFVPDTSIRVGVYIYHADKTYLATDGKIDETLYPELTGELCNSHYPARTEITRELIGRDPNTGRPFYEEKEEIIHTPCVVNYQPFISDNGRFLLPKGRLRITLDYDESVNMEMSREFSMYEDRYKITDIDLTKVLNGIGIATITCEVVV